MPTPWFRRAKASGQLTVVNKAGAWSTAVNKALATFNGLGFPVTLVAGTDEKNANIVVKLSMGPDSATSWGQTASTGSDFDPKKLHGLTVPLTETHERPRKTFEIIFAAIFLPGKADATAGQREVIAVHEFIHACGLDGGMPDGSKNKNQDHDSEGIMYDIMVPQGDGLIEASKPQGVR
ncbi:MAG: hypothetical protein ACRD43_08465, partial [Pyrinomonadaceae bacterium]